MSEHYVISQTQALPSVPSNYQCCSTLLMMSLMKTMKLMTFTVFAPVPRKRGHPKCSSMKAIKLRQEKVKFSAKIVPLHRKDSATKQHCILVLFFVFVEKKDTDEVLRAIEFRVETIPENIPLAALYSHANFFPIFFDGDGFIAFAATTEERRQLPRFCHSCQQSLDGQSIGCDRCMNWQHRSCASIKSQPKQNFADVNLRL